MNKSPAFQFYPKEWLSSMDIMLMTPEQEGAYIRLLCICWESGDCSIPDDDNQLATLSRLGQGWLNGGSAVVRKKFIPHPHKSGYLTNERLIKEANKQKQWAEKSSIGGKKSAERRAKQQSKLDNGSRVVDKCLEKDSNQEPTLQSPVCSLHTAVITPVVPIGDENEMNAFRRARALFNMRELTNSTPIDKSLERAWKGAKEVVMATFDDEWDALEARYSSTDPEIARYRRRDLPTLLNNWTGEITKSKNQHNQFTTQPKHDHRAEKRAREFPEQIVVPLI